MGSRLGRRVIHFANLPIKLQLPSPPFDSIREFSLKTIPSATKVEIRRVLESLYGFDIAEVRTLNREGKKIKHGPFLVAKPDYKKAYVTLRSPLSLNPDLFPIKLILDERERIAAASKAAKTAVVSAEDGRTERKHWLDEGRRADEDNGRRGYAGARGAGGRGRGYAGAGGAGGRGRGYAGAGGAGGRGRRQGYAGAGGAGRGKNGPAPEESKFPWSGMRLSQSSSSSGSSMHSSKHCFDEGRRADEDKGRRGAGGRGRRQDYAGAGGAGGRRRRQGYAGAGGAGRGKNGPAPEKSKFP